MKPLFRGKLLDRRYRVIRTLARGGFGETYIAEDTRLPGNPHCVVKHLKPLNSNPGLLENAKRLFLAEAETLQKLGKHDQIPQLLAYFEENREFYLIQELIEGHTLTQELVPSKPWAEKQVVQLLQSVLGILGFVHRHGVIHRDIKPDNIIRRDQDQKLVLVDFGTVKQVVASQTQVGTTIVAGTPGYMPTEQGRGKPRPNSDIYALGIIGIQAITGLNPNQLQEDVATGEILWQPWATCSDGLAAILTRMVRYHFKDRYQSAEEALQDLEALRDQAASLTSHSNTASRNTGDSDTILAADRISIEENSDAAHHPSRSTIVSLESPESSRTIESAGAIEEPRLEEIETPAAETITVEPTATLISQDLPAAIIAEPTATLISQDLSASSIPEPTDTLVSANPPTPVIPEPTATLISQEPLAASIAEPTTTLISSDLKPQAATHSAQTSPPSVTEPTTTVISHAVPPTVVKPISTEQSPPAKQPKALPPRRLSWAIGVGSLAVMAGAIGGVFWFQKQQIHLQMQSALEDTKNLKSQSNYEACIQKAQGIPQEQIAFYPTAQTLLGDCQIALAQQFAKEGKFSSAINTAGQISRDYSAYSQVQPLLTQWSDRILKLATEQYEAGKLSNALSTVKAIPETSVNYGKAQSAIKKWNEEWKSNNTHFAAAEKALKEGKWQLAKNEAAKVTTVYWKRKAEPVIKRATDEIAADERAAQLSRQRSQPEAQPQWEPAPEPQWEPVPQPRWEPAPEPRWEPAPQRRSEPAPTVTNPDCPQVACI